MTTLLERAFVEVSKLPAQEQDTLVPGCSRSWRQSEAGAASLPSRGLSRLAEEALAEYRAGYTRPLGLSRL